MELIELINNQMINKFSKNFQKFNCRVRFKKILNLLDKEIEYFNQLITFLILGQLDNKNIHN